ncbi:MAG: SlyX family protein [Pseudomonadota bacterium]
MSDLEARVTELEVKLGFAEDLIDSLNQTMFRQQERLDLMQREMTELYRRIREAEAHEQRDPSEEIPPHY